MSINSPRHSLRDLAEKLPFLHPQPTPRSSRDWSHDPSRRTSIGLPTPASGGDGGRATFLSGYRRVKGRGAGHRRQLGLSSFSPRGVLCFLLVLVVLFVLGGGRAWFRSDATVDDGGWIPLGQSRLRGGREVFWWEQFERLDGFYKGRREVVSRREWVAEQDGGLKFEPEGERQGVRTRDLGLVELDVDKTFVPCYVDEERGIYPPKLSAYKGLPQGFPAPLFGSHKELGLRDDVCYDRINRYGPYGFGSSKESGGLGVEMPGDSEGMDQIQTADYSGVRWGPAQDNCLASQYFTGSATAFIIRTWHDFEYTPYHIAMLRAIISELVFATGGKYIVHFLIHVRNDSIPIWASDNVYNQVLRSSLPTEFAGMGTLWSTSQMKMVYPGPFNQSIENFSGSELYGAYRSLHFPLQLFAEKHPAIQYFWQWEMDIRVTGSYLELLEQVTDWTEKQEAHVLWEKSAKFYIPKLFNDSYEAYEASVQSEYPGTGRVPVSGPQLPSSKRLSIPGITDDYPKDGSADLITFSPLFDPERTRWAFHNDITGYPQEERPPTRAALITASRLSRRLLMTMHHETYEQKHTMFPEMFPASIALHYGYKAVYAPLPIYFDRDWPSDHADEVFNNVVIGKEGNKAGMDHGSGHFHGEGGSVFGPGEHVFRGASWYSNAAFAGYLWRRWLGRENGNNEIAWESERARGRMCLPMMVLHPVKNE